LYFFTDSQEDSGVHPIQIAQKVHRTSTEKDALKISTMAPQIR
jgi:hypothetical protein